MDESNNPPAATEQPPPKKRHRRTAAERRAADAELRAKERQAVALLQAGATYQQIADRLGYASTSSAFDAVQRGLEGVATATEEVRRLELSRLDALLLSWWQAALGTPAAAGRAATPPDSQAFANVMRIMERRAKLLGLDKPYEIDIEQLARAAAIALGEDPDEAVFAARRINNELANGKLRLLTA